MNFHFDKYIVVLFLVISSLSFAHLRHPSDNSNLNYIYVPFEWNQEPDVIGYNLQVLNLQQEIILNIDTETNLYMDKSGQLEWDNSYQWRVRGEYESDLFSEWIDTWTFTIGEKADIELNIEVLNTDLIQNGFYLYSQWIPFIATVLIDENGNQIWNSQDLYMNHVNINGQMFGFDQGGIEFNFDNDRIWTTPDNYLLDSHEFKNMPNGNYMALDKVTQTGVIPIGEWTSSFQDLGYVADGVTEEYPWFAHRLVEFDKETKQEVWSWNPFDHFSLDDFDIYGGTWWNAFNGWFSAGSYDWLHANAFEFDAEENVIYLSLRHISRLSKIDYASGQVIWNLGLSPEYNTGYDNICTDLNFSWQHHIQVLDNGELLFFDNGNLSEMLMGDPYPTSRIRRIKVIDNEYCETVWQYDLPYNLHGGGAGSVQYLSNGNYCIYTLGNGLGEAESTLMEITSEGNLAWKATAVNPSTAWYRAYKVTDIHPQVFSVYFNDFKTINVDGNNLNGIVIDNITSPILFSVRNHSEYQQNYVIEYRNSINGNVDETFRDTLIIQPNMHYEMAFQAIMENDSNTSIHLDVWPIHHEYEKKSFNHDVYLSDGDLQTKRDLNRIKFISTHNYPNPFNFETRIRYTLSNGGHVKVTIYNMLGQVVKELINDIQEIGYKTLKWDGRDDKGQIVPTGVYIYFIETNGLSSMKKMIFLK